MPLTYANQITMEKSPDYFINPEVAKRIYDWNPNLKMILLIRDPVKRALSHFAHFLSIVNKTNYESTKYDVISKMFDKSVFYKNGSISRNRWINGGLYSEHYKVWLKFFKKEQFLFLNGENFITHPYEEVKKVENFLGLNPFIQKEHFVYDNQKGFFCKRKDLSKNKLECMGSEKGRKHPFISTASLDKLNQFYKPFSSELFKLIDQKPYW